LNFIFGSDLFQIIRKESVFDVIEYKVLVDLGSNFTIYVSHLLC